MDGSIPLLISEDLLPPPIDLIETTTPRQPPLLPLTNEFQRNQTILGDVPIPTIILKCTQFLMIRIQGHRV